MEKTFRDELAIKYAEIILNKLNWSSETPKEIGQKCIKTLIVEAYDFADQMIKERNK